MPGELNLYVLYVYCVVHIYDFGMLRVNIMCLQIHITSFQEDESMM